MQARKKAKNIGSKHFASRMMMPTLITMLVMTVYPMVSTLGYSLTNFRLLKKNVEFVGTKNFVNLLSNEYFQSAIWVTVKFTLLCVIFEMLLGFIFALYVNSLKSSRVQKVMRTLLPSLVRSDVRSTAIIIAGCRGCQRSIQARISFAI